MRIPTTTIATTAALAFGVATLAACGTSEDPKAADYCKELRSFKASFQSVGGTDADVTKLDGALKRMHSLAAVAPAAVARNWKQIDGIVVTIQKGLDDAGVDFADLAAMQKGDIPKGVNLDKVAALTPKLKRLSGSGFTRAADGIADHAKHECGVDLTAS